MTHLLTISTIDIMQEKISTIEDLALLIQRTMASKEDLAGLASKDDLVGLASKEDIQEVNNRLDHLDARVGSIEADINEMNDNIVYRHEFEDVLGRVKYVERKLGIESGV